MPQPFAQVIALKQPVEQFLRRHEDKLWWLHSAYALLLGVFVMWLGSRDFNYLRIIIFHIAFIWVTSLLVPVLVNLRRLPPKWRRWVRPVVNYFNKNFYQQLLFFVLPIYYASTTPGSRNVLFIVLLAVSAVLSTLDIVYDRYLSVRWPLTALFFAFNLFACINVMLPVLWGIGNSRSLIISGILAFAGFATMIYRLSGLRRPWARLALIPASIGMLLMVYLLRSFIPPAPLSLVGAEFGRSVRNLQAVDALSALPPPGTGRIAVLTAIKAPLGLEEMVCHRWYLDGRQIFVSPYYSMTGGREEGYRLWTGIVWSKEYGGRELTVDVETQFGQLIGRAKLRQ